MAKTKPNSTRYPPTKFMEAVAKLLSEQGEGSPPHQPNEIAIPTLDEEGNEEFLVLVFKVPTGSRDGDAYDGYSMAEDYAMKVRESRESRKDQSQKRRKRKSHATRLCESRKQKPKPSEKPPKPRARERPPFLSSPI